MAKIDFKNGIWKITIFQNPMEWFLIHWKNNKVIYLLKANVIIDYKIFEEKCSFSEKYDDFKKTF